MVERRAIFSHKNIRAARVPEHAMTRLPPTGDSKYRRKFCGQRSDRLTRAVGLDDRKIALIYAINRFTILACKAFLARRVPPNHGISAARPTWRRSIRRLVEYPSVRHENSYPDACSAQATRRSPNSDHAARGDPITTAITAERMASADSSDSKERRQTCSPTNHQPS